MHGELGTAELPSVVPASLPHASPRVFAKLVLATALWLVLAGAALAVTARLAPAAAPPLAAPPGPAADLTAAVTWVAPISPTAMRRNKV